MAVFFTLLVAAASAGLVSSQQCPSTGCPDLSSHNIDLSPLTGMWDTLYFGTAQGSKVANIPHFFNFSLCGGLQHPQTQCRNSSVCYSPELQTFYDIGMTSSCYYSYADRKVKFTYSFSSAAVDLYGAGNVTVTLICGRTLGVPQVINGDIYAEEISIVWETSAACKNTSSLHYTPEAKCYHIHSYHDSGLKASFIDLTSLVRPLGYQVVNTENTQYKFLISVCRPLRFGSDDTDHPSECNGTMACLIGAGGNLGQSPPLELGSWSGGGQASSRLHMHEGLLTMEYSTNRTQGGCGGNRTVRLHFICPSENQILGPHITFMDSQVCLTIVTWYTSFACGLSAIQTQGCALTTQEGLQFNFTSLGRNVYDINSTVTSGGVQSSYIYSIQICRAGGEDFTGCTPPPTSGSSVIQRENENCRSLGTGMGTLRYADGALTLTYSNGDSCNSNFARTTSITFLCPENLDKERANTSSLTFLGEEDCFYQFEWVTELACGSKTSGISTCQFQANGGSRDTYNFAPLVGTEDRNWVSVDTNRTIACFMLNPCGELSVTASRNMTGTDYCNSRRAPLACGGASVCRISLDGSAVRIGKFDLTNSSSIDTIDDNIMTIYGRMGGNSSDVNNTAVVHYVCKTGDLFSPPVYLGVTNNDQFYEFHWNTFAACPRGVESGQHCSVTYHGYVFNLTSLPRLLFTTDDYRYEISVCSALRSNETGCNDSSSHNAAVCQVKTSSSQHFKLGEPNSTLVYEDGSLRLQYNNGQSCHSGANRNTTLLFICDSSAHQPTVNDVTEDHCEYVIEVRTKLACPPAVRASECVFFNGTKSYDFSDLSRSPYQGNWEARDPDGSVYYINVCETLNLVEGCSVLAGVCKKTSDSHGNVNYTNLGLAYGATFNYAQRNRDEVIQLTYQYSRQLVGPLPEGECRTVQTIIEFTCNKSTFNSEVGPHYISGGDVQNRCTYRFLWETVGACPIQPIRSHTCKLDLPSGFSFDLSPLQHPLNTTAATLESIASQNATHHISTGGDNPATFDLAICGYLPTLCNNQSGVAVCQNDSVHHVHSCANSSTLQLLYFDDSLSLTYKGGDLCHHNERERRVRVNFECDRKANLSVPPRYIEENECEYSFEWATPLACPPLELSCVAAGGKYDLTPLLANRVWQVDTDGAGEGESYHYVIGGCRSLSIDDVQRCPHIPGMGACRYSTHDDDSLGSVLGFVTGDIVEESEGVLRLEYHNGYRCSDDGRSSMVHVHFTCGQGTGSGVPTLAPFSDSCHTHINWVTAYACSRNSRSEAREWSLVDPVTHFVYNFTSLNGSLSARTLTERGEIYNYTVSLNNGAIPCPSSRTSPPTNPGACQVKVSGGCGISDSNCVYTLGLLGTNGSSLSMLDGSVRVEYRGGDRCHHPDAPRKAVVTFECDNRDSPILEVVPENSCEYAFVVHTHLACPGGTSIGVECRAEGFHDLVTFQRLSALSVVVPGRGTVFLAVCDTVGPHMYGCDPSAGACLREGTGHTINLGKPSSRYPPTPLEGNMGVVLRYTQGDMCNETSGERYNSTVILFCNRNVNVGTPEFVEISSNCHFTFRWESSAACPTDIPTSSSSNSVCKLRDPYANDLILDFSTFVQNRTLTSPDPHTGNKYFVQLCGTTIHSPPAGCDQSNTGVCRQDASGHNQTLVYANHTFSLVSHSPRVVEVIFHKGVACGSDSSNARHWTAIVQMVCSNQTETPYPVFASDDGCELRFVWRNQSFCAGESAAGGCVAVDSDRYVFSLDGLLAQNWTGLASAPGGGAGGTFSLGICRNLNPFSFSGLHCSSPSAVCWHTTDNRHINLGRSKFPPNVVTSKETGEKSIHIAYSEGDTCNGSTTYHTDLYIRCSDTTSSPTMTYATNRDCSFVVTMLSPLACKIDHTSTPNCSITTPTGVFNFSSLAKTAQDVTDLSTGDKFKICLCGNTSSCHYPGISKVIGGQDPVSLGHFQDLSVSSSTGGPRLSYYGGDQCPGQSGSTKLQSWLFMECNRDISNQKFTLLESASSQCVKVFVWYTNQACLSPQVTCSLNAYSSSNGDHFFYDFTPLHAHALPWRVQDGEDTYYINICGNIVNRYGYHIQTCSSDAAICVKPGGGQDAYAIAIAGTQQFYYDNTNVVLRFTGPESSSCRGDHTPRVSITMTCGVGGLSLQEKGQDCQYRFVWRTAYACKEKPRTFTKCQDVMKATNDFTFYPLKIANSSGYTYHSHEGLMMVNICGPCTRCSNRDASVCLSRDTTIATTHNQSIIVDGYQMMIHMNGPDNKHAIVKVVCELKSQTTKHDPNQPLVLDNHAENGGHHYYYFTLYTQEGTGCSFTAPSNAPVAPAASSTEPPPASKKSDSTKAAGIIIGISIVTVAVVSMLLIAVFYKKERRERVRKALVYLKVRKSSESVRYHKRVRGVSRKSFALKDLSRKDEQQSLLDQSDSNNEEEEDILGREEHGGGASGEDDNKENSDEELINL